MRQHQPSTFRHMMTKTGNTNNSNSASGSTNTNRYRVRCLHCGWRSVRVDSIPCLCYADHAAFCKPGTPGPGCPRGLVYPHPKCSGQVVVDGKIGNQKYDPDPTQEIKRREALTLTWAVYRAVQDTLSRNLEDDHELDGSCISIVVARLPNGSTTNPMTVYAERELEECAGKYKITINVDPVPDFYAVGQTYDWAGTRIEIQRVGAGQKWADCLISTNGSKKARRKSLPLPSDAILISEVH